MISSKYFSQRFKSKKAFTLIELLVVIAIISLLATMVILVVNDKRVDARDVRRKEDLKHLQAALEMYYTDHEFYPSSNVVVPDEWQYTSDCGGSYITISTDDDFLKELVDEDLLSDMFRDPNNNGTHFYVYGNWSNESGASPCTVSNQYYRLAVVLEKEPVAGDSDCLPEFISSGYCLYVLHSGI